MIKNQIDRGNNIIKLSKNENAFLKEYEILTSSAIQVTTWRQNSNNFYLTVNTGFILLGSYLLSVGVYSGIFLVLFISIQGILISYLWLQTIKYYSTLNEIKFQLINKMEEKLPIPIFKKEWELFSKKQVPKTTKIEKMIPRVFLISYLFILIVSISIVL